MRINNFLDLFFFACVAATVLSGAVGCSTTVSSTTPGGPGGSAVINSDSIITAEIKAIREQSAGFSWEVDILVKTSENVGDLPNPTRDSIGKVITVKTDENMTVAAVGDIIKAKVKYTGDVPKPGITLYLYEVALQ
jgi:hypothetical protein